MRQNLSRFAIACLTVAAAALSAPLHAVPLLQLYVEGATYDTEHESWVFDLTTSHSIRLWAIGNIAGPGGKGTISDVKLSAVYRDVNAGSKDADIILTGSTTGGFGGFTDPSIAAIASLNGYNDSGDVPLLSDGSALAPHGTYGEGWEWQEFALGDFDLTDSPIADFITEFPDVPLSTSGAHISVYNIEIDASIDEIHFDLYDSIAAKNGARAVFAPYSHDAGTGTNHSVPEPTPLFLLAVATLVYAFRCNRRGAAAAFKR